MRALGVSILPLRFKRGQRKLVLVLIFLLLKLDILCADFYFPRLHLNFASLNLNKPFHHFWWRRARFQLAFA
jgi:hypothetical protein